MNFKIVIPTYNPGKQIRELVPSLLQQVSKNDILVIDSSSSDCTAEYIKSMEIECISIKKDEFGHGKTRKMAVELLIDVDTVVFMTQDVLPFDKDCVKKLVDYLYSDEKISAVYGRQVAYPNAEIFAEFSREYNYYSESYVRSLEDKKKFGIKTVFFSDSFAAYKRNILLEMGNFPNVNFGEDTYMAGVMLLAGYKIGYCADALVYHSHDYGIMEELARSREIGKFHKEHPWLLENFGKAEGEGFKFVLAEARYLLKNGKWYLLPKMILRDAAKYLGYRLG